jgi:type 1 glutamine amidotransferase
VREEFYYRLKFPKTEPPVTPLINVAIDEEHHTVAWAWERPDGGRSFGFSGGHFHENWNKPEYRRLLAQSILWSLDISIPKDGLNVDLEDKLLQLAPRDRKSP